VPDQGDAAAVVVHFESPETLLLTLTDLGEFFPRDRIVVVDSSGDLDDSWDAGAVILRPGRNTGYARGANDGVRYLLASRPDVTEILVCTHEVRFADGVIDRLLEVAQERPGGHVIAPRLVTRGVKGQAPTLWSEGGRLSFPLRHPEHVRVGRTHGTRRALWVDGAAFVIAVRTWQRVGGIPEEFFLYMEDVALGLRCRRLGEPVVVVLDAVVEQAVTEPNRYLAIRNQLILAERYYSRLDSAVVHAQIYAKTIALALLGERGRARAIENRRAIRDARRRVRAAAAGGDLPRPRGRAWRPDRPR
jgi:GT2 family glycosyltransferase